MKNTANQIISPPQGVRIDKRAHVRIGSGCGFPIFFSFTETQTTKKRLKMDCVLIQWIVHPFDRLI